MDTLGEAKTLFMGGKTTAGMFIWKKNNVSLYFTASPKFLIRRSEVQCGPFVSQEGSLYQTYFFLSHYWVHPTQKGLMLRARHSWLASKVAEGFEVSEEEAKAVVRKSLPIINDFLSGEAKAPNHILVYYQPRDEATVSAIPTGFF